MSAPAPITFEQFQATGRDVADVELGPDLDRDEDGGQPEPDPVRVPGRIYLDRFEVILLDGRWQTILGRTTHCSPHLPAIERLLYDFALAQAVAPDTPPVTRVIGGHDFTLTPGRIYRASRPFARRGAMKHAVAIRDVTDGIDIDTEAEADPAAVVWNLTYDEANALLAAFNHGKPGLFGRVW